MAYDHAKDDHPDWTDEQLNDFISNNKLLWHYMEKEFYGGDASNYKAQNNTRVSASSTTQSSAPNEEQQAARQRSEERVKNNPLYNEVIDMLKYMYPNFNDAALLDTAIEILDVASYEEEVENLRREYAAKKASDGVAKTEVAAVPQAETPAVSTTKAETPSVEAPKVETPKVQTTTTVTPSVKAPTVTSTVETPKAATPKVATPKVETATVEAPVDSAPTVSTPKVETPEVEPVVASTPKVETLSATPSVANTATAPAAALAATPAVTQPTVTQSATSTTVAAPKVETTKSNKNKFQQRIDEQAAAMEKAYADLRDIYDDPTDEQILAVAGNNLRGYQRKMGNTAGNWGTAFGSNAMWGTLNKNTRDALEAGYQAGLEAKKKALPNRRAESVYTLGEGEGAKKVTKGMQMDARNWGDSIKDTENITPEQVRKLNEIMKTGGFTEFSIPTTQVTTKNEQGEDVVTDVEQNTSLYDLLESATPEEIEALEYLGFIDDYDGSYTRPHNETFDEKLARKEREQARIDLLTQQRALERQRARTGLADLAAGVGDMIKASNGAIVTPRDYQAMYDTLTAQQKVNYNNYLARMQAMKEAEKAKAKEAADRIRQETLLKEQRKYQEEMQAKQWAHDEDVLEQKLQNKLKEIRERGKEKRKEIDTRYKNQQDRFNNAGSIVFGGIDYTFDKAHNNNAISSLLSIVRNYFTEENGYLSMLEGIENSSMSEYSKAYDTANAVVSALSEFENQFSSDDRENIIRILSQYANSKKSVSGGGGSAPVTPTSAEATKKYKAPNGTIITQEQYNGLSQAQKDKCEPINE